MLRDTTIDNNWWYTECQATYNIRSIDSSNAIIHFTRICASLVGGNRMNLGIGIEVEIEMVPESVGFPQCLYSSSSHWFSPLPSETLLVFFSDS